MGKIIRFLRSFFDVQRSLKARFFVSFSAVTLTITALISLYWYQKIIQTTTDTLVENMEVNLTSRLVQLENSFEDVKRMHSTILYETNSLGYIVRDSVSPPTADWFEDYNRLQTNLRMMGITLSRTLSGTGVFKKNGSTCISGTLGVEWDFIGKSKAQRIREGEGRDVMFFLDKPAGEVDNEAPKYLFVGRSVLDGGEERAIILSRLNESLLTETFQNSAYAGGFVWVLDQEYNVVYDSNPQEYDDQKARYLAQLAGGLSPSAAQGYTVFSTSSSHTGLTAISSVSKQFIRDSYREVRIQLTVLLLAVVLVVGAISMLLANRITLGIQWLAQNMRRAGKGEMTIEGMRPIPGNDEVGWLYQVFLKMIRQIQNLLQSVKENERQKRQMEMKVLRAQISPHFLYNSLNTINYLALLQNAQNIHILVSSLIDLLQGAVDVDEVLVPLADEVKYVKSYMNIQQYRFPRQIQVDYRVDDSLTGWLVPKMILQPIVENALIHGFREEQENPLLTIKAYTLDQSGLIISVTDNGVGMDSATIERVMKKEVNRDKMRFSGIGISNVDARIKLQLGEEYGLFIYSREGRFTTVEIRLPKSCTNGEKEALQ